MLLVPLPCGERLSRPGHACTALKGRGACALVVVLGLACDNDGVSGTLLFVSKFCLKYRGALRPAVVGWLNTFSCDFTARPCGVLLCPRFLRVQRLHLQEWGRYCRYAGHTRIESVEKQRACSYSLICPEM